MPIRTERMYRFAAMISVAGTVRSAPGLFRSDEFAADIRTHGYFRAPDPFIALSHRLRCMPITVYHGSEDRVVLPQESRRIVAVL